MTRWRPRVVTVAGAGNGESAEASDVAIIRSWAPPWSHLTAMAALNAATLTEALRFRPDVVLSMHIVAAPATTIIGRLLWTPIVQYVYGTELGGRPKLARLALRAADAVVALSDYTEGLATAAGADPKSFVRIPPGVDIPARRESRSERPLLITVATLDFRYKGHDVIARALPLVLARVPEAEWVVVGDGPLRPYLEGLIDAHHLDGSVRFLGALLDDERDAWLDRAQVFAMPSRLPKGAPGGEGFGIVYLEAGAHGLPVVAGNVGGAVDAVMSDGTGLLVNPEDHIAVADAITELLLDRDRAATMGSAGAARAAEFAWPEIAAKVEKVLDEVTGQ